MISLFIYFFLPKSNANRQTKILLIPLYEWMELVVDYNLLSYSWMLLFHPRGKIEVLLKLHNIVSELFGDSI